MGSTLDFYCPAKKLAIEIDGDSHFIRWASEKDKDRQHWIEQHKIDFLRFTNDEIQQDLDDVLDEIEHVLKEKQ